MYREKERANMNSNDKAEVVIPTDKIPEPTKMELGVATFTPDQVREIKAAVNTHARKHMKEYKMWVSGYLTMMANSPEHALEKYKRKRGKKVTVELIHNSEDEDNFKRNCGMEMGTINL